MPLRGQFRKFLCLLLIGVGGWAILDGTAGADDQEGLDAIAELVDCLRHDSVARRCAERGGLLDADLSPRCGADPASAL